MFFNNDDDDDDFGGDFRDLNDIINEFNKAKKGDNSVNLSEEDLEFLIDYYNSENDKKNVEIAFDLGLKMYPFSSSFLIFQAEWLMEQTKFGQALRSLDDADLIDPYNFDALFLRVDIYTEMNKHKEAIVLLEKSLEYFNGEEMYDLLIEISELYDEIEEYELVYQTLKRILELNPQHEDALLRICFWADITSHQEDAIVLYNKVIDENPFNAVAWYNLGVAYQGIKLYEKAVESYICCIDLDENFEYAYRNLGDAHIQLKQFDKAIEVLEKHLTIGTVEDVILEAIAYCWEKKKQYGIARNFYRQASQLNPEDDSIFYKIGETYTKEYQWEKASKAFTLAINLNKLNVNYCMALGNCLMEMNDSKEALIVYLRAVRLKPSVKAPWICLIKALYYTGYIEEANAQLIIAESNCGPKPEFVFIKAALQLALGRTKEALLFLEEAMELAPKKVAILNQIDREIMMHPKFLELVSRYKKK